MFLKRLLGTNVKVELDLSVYVTEADFKNALGVDTLDFIKKTDLGNLKLDIDKLDIHIFKNAPSIFRCLEIKIEKYRLIK